jgi:hypothetical protein
MDKSEVKWINPNFIHMFYLESVPYFNPDRLTSYPD